METPPKVPGKLKEMLESLRSHLPEQLQGVDLGATSVCYLAVESCWHVGLYSACYHYEPLLWLRGRPWGNTLANKRSTGRRIGYLDKMLLEAPWKRAAAEWFLLNKIVGIPLFPVKVALGATLAYSLSQRGNSNEDGCS